MVSLVQITLTDLMADKIKHAYTYENSTLLSQLKANINQFRIGEGYTFNEAVTEKIRQLSEICELLKFGQIIMVDLRTARLIDEIVNG